MVEVPGDPATEPGGDTPENIAARIAWTPNPDECVIVCAANRHKVSGRIIAGPRHWDAIMRAQVHRETEDFGNWEQGFIDQFCQWYTREEAYVIAERHGQIKNPLAHAVGYLYSENLY